MASDVVSRDRPAQADSHEKSLQRGKQDIQHLVDTLSIRPANEAIDSAHRLYKLVLNQGFTRGRRTNQVRHALLDRWRASVMGVTVDCRSCLARWAERFS